MITRSTLAALVCLTALVAADTAQAAKTHLLILSGQSNMAGLKPEVSFTPAVTKALAGDEVIVVKHARGGQPIRRWYKKWKPAKGEKPKADGALYDQLMARVKKAVGDKKPDTVTFVWMQGERDAKEGHGTVYEASLAGLLQQLRDDLGARTLTSSSAGLATTSPAVRDFPTGTSSARPKWRWPMPARAARGLIPTTSTARRTACTTPRTAMPSWAEGSRQRR